MIIVKSARSDHFAVGVTELDSEHQVQVGLVIALQKAVVQRQEPAIVGDILDRLSNYTNTHFMAEQLLMQLYEYPYYDAHVEQHDLFMARLRTLQQRYHSENLKLTEQAIIGLKNWILAHIQGPDRGLAEYLTERGIGGHAARQGSLAVL